MSFLGLINLAKMYPHKRPYWDNRYFCFRLIDPSYLYEYPDGEGKWHKRANISDLISIEL